MNNQKFKSNVINSPIIQDVLMGPTISLFKSIKNSRTV
jgi:hypothetical protein